MLMEQEAPLLFHTVFAGAVILTVAYLLHWRGHSPQKKPLELILYFVLLQIPAYILVFYAMMCPGSGCSATRFLRNSDRIIEKK